MFTQVEQEVQNGVEWLRLAVETLGAIVIAAGALVALAGLLRYFAGREGPTFTPIRLSFARYLTLPHATSRSLSSCSWRRIFCRRPSRQPGTGSAS